MAQHTTTLRNRVVELAPLRLEDAGPLLHAAETPETFRYFSRPPITWDTEGMRGYARFLIEHPAILPFTVRLAGTGVVVGSSTYCDLRPDDLGVEIGWTWYTPTRRGSPVNPACKLLMLGHAFSGALFGRPAVRVSLKTDARNAHSLAAIAKLGATREGTLRSHVLMPDGHRRDTVYHSVLDAEWPGVRDRLERRLSDGSGG